ncbi:MAG: FAD-dependent oxidoreductase [Methylocella sp.]
MYQPDHVLVVGAGIAGISVAAKLARRGVSVSVLEQYDEYHYGATGRSAALLATTYFSSEEFAILTKATQPAFEKPVEGFTDAQLLRDRGALYFAGDEDATELAKFCWRLGGAEIPLVELYRKDVLELVPIIRRDKVIFGVYEKDAKNMDVHGIFQAYERQAKRNGAQIVPGAELLSARWTGKFRIVNAARGIFQADTIIKCSGRVG